MGRVIRDAEGHVIRIVEEADLPPGDPVPMECNAGVYVFDGAQLWPAPACALRASRSPVM